MIDRLRALLAEYDATMIIPAEGSAAAALSRGVRELVAALELLAPLPRPEGGGLAENVRMLLANHDARMATAQKDGAEEQAELPSHQSLTNALRLALRLHDRRNAAPVANPEPAEMTVHERHSDGWHEWSIGDAAPPKSAPAEPPHRLFVRQDGNGSSLVEIVLCRSTSYAATARQLDGAQADRISLTSAELRWLIEVLPRALAYKEQRDEPDQSEGKDEIPW